MSYVDETLQDFVTLLIDDQYVDIPHYAYRDMIAIRTTYGSKRGVLEIPLAHVDAVTIPIMEIVLHYAKFRHYYECSGEYGWFKVDSSSNVHPYDCATLVYLDVETLKRLAECCRVLGYSKLLHIAETFLTLSHGDVDVSQ